MSKALKNIADEEFDSDFDTTDLEFEEVEAEEFTNLDFAEEVDFLFD